MRSFETRKKFLLFVVFDYVYSLIYALNLNVLIFEILLFMFLTGKSAEFDLLERIYSELNVTVMLNN